MKRRQFIALLGGAATWPLGALAQQPAIPVVGFLDVRSPDALGVRLRAFHQGLKESGFVEGDNVSILYRFAENRSDRLAELAADLVKRNVAVITTAGPPAAFAAKAATNIIPTLFIVAQNPVSIGLVASLARPGGNLTGINLFNTEVTAKRLDLLRELVPKAARVAVLVHPADAENTNSTLEAVQAAAGGMGVHIEVLNANSNREINAAFEKIGSMHPDALFVGASPYLHGRRIQIVQLAAFHPCHLRAT